MKHAPLRLPTIASLRVRTNPEWDPIERLGDAIRRSNMLTTKLKQATRLRSRLDADPDVILLCAHITAQVVLAKQAMHFKRALAREGRTSDFRTWPEFSRSRFQKLWKVAEDLEAKAKLMRRDPDWKTWVAIQAPRSNGEWHSAEKNAAKAEEKAIQALIWFKDESYDSAHDEIKNAGYYTSDVLHSYNYHELAKQMDKTIAG